MNACGLTCTSVLSPGLPAAAVNPEDHRQVLRPRRRIDVEHLPLVRRLDVGDVALDVLSVGGGHESGGHESGGHQHRGQERQEQLHSRRPYNRRPWCGRYLRGERRRLVRRCMRHNRARPAAMAAAKTAAIRSAEHAPKFTALAGHSQFAAQRPRTEAKKQNSPQVASRYFANGPTGLEVSRLSMLAVALVAARIAAAARDLIGRAVPEHVIDLAVPGVPAPDQSSADRGQRNSRQRAAQEPVGREHGPADHRQLAFRLAHVHLLVLPAAPVPVSIVVRLVLCRPGVSFSGNIRIHRDPLLESSARKSLLTFANDIPTPAVSNARNGPLTYKSR